ncbi:McrC family protein [Acidobacteriota bacterium]
MPDQDPQIIFLQEYKPLKLPRNNFTHELGQILWNRYKKQVSIETPSFKTDNEWQITSQGWVGYIPLSNDFHISLQPKIPLSNLFLMLEYAYNLKSFEFIDGLMNSDSLKDFYERLALILAKRVMDRGRKGFYRSYLNLNERLSCIRGRLDIQNVIQRPWECTLLCHFQDHTADIDDNQIIGWTLHSIPKSGLCTIRSLPTIRKAYRSLAGFISLIPQSPAECIGRLYNRLNADYHPMHCLCRFFLEHSGPSHKIGDHTFLPFLVDMSRLYEKFVAEWLKKRLPDVYTLKIQENIKIGPDKDIEFKVDLVIYEKTSDKACFVLDTKYKVPNDIQNTDLSQVVTYAEAKGCPEAVLIYPANIPRPINEKIGDKKVRTLSFCLDGNLDKAGDEFISRLLRPT